LREKFYSVLNHLSETPEAQATFYLVESGTFSSNNCNIERPTINLGCVAQKLATKTRLHVYTSENDHCDRELLMNDFDTWILKIKESAEKYFAIPQTVNLATKALALGNKDVSLDDRVSCIRELFAIVNVDFLKCSDSCQSPSDCMCVRVKFEECFNNFNKGWFPCGGNTLKSDERKIKHIKAFAEYLAPDIDIAKNCAAKHFSHPGNRSVDEALPVVNSKVCHT
jgi:hypothetical protein